MLDLIALIIFMGSLIGLVVFLVLKIPVLKKLKTKSSKQGELVLKIKKQAKEIIVEVRRVLKFVLSDVFLQKALSKIRVLALKVENRCSQGLEKSRSQVRERKEAKDYWQNLKKLSLKKSRRKKK